MSRFLLPFIIVVSVLGSLHAQDIPLFSQKLSNSLIYNPAMAGNTFGSATYTFRKNYANVKGSPQNNLISLHTPLANYRFGVGATVYQEQVNFIKTTYSTVAFAYHIHFNRFSTLSMGVSGEYRTLGLSGDSNTLSDDPELDKIRLGKLNSYDVSYGMNFQNRYIKVGLAANRLATTWLNGGSPSLSHGYFSGTVQGIFHVRGDEDLLEPYFSFRKFSDINDTYDIGLYYTVSNKFVFGLASRNKPSSGGNMIASATLGFRPSRNLLIGYSREMIVGGVGGYVGSANEITLRLDFNNKAYKETYRSNFKEAVNFRRKTLSNNFSGAKSPKQMKKQQGKMKAFSPNTRYENIKKLSSSNTIKKSSAPKKKFRKTRKIKTKKFKKRY